MGGDRSDCLLLDRGQHRNGHYCRFCPPSIIESYLEQPCHHVSEADLYLLYELEEKAGAIKQGNMDLETYYRQIHGLWINVDRCQKQPIDCCDKGVSQYRTHSNTKRLLKFLSGLNGEYESIKRDILKEVPIPSVETA